MVQSLVQFVLQQCFCLQFYYFTLQTMATFKLSNINLQVDVPMFSQNSHKYLKVQVVEPKELSHSIVKLKESAEVINEKSLQWHESLVLPSRFGKKFQFQILNSSAHNFKYNPEEPEMAIEGFIVIKKEDGDYTGWEVAINGKKVGFLFANVEVYSKLGNKQQIKMMENNSSFFGTTISVNKDSVAITSIYANFPRLNRLDKTRVFIEFEMGGYLCRSAIKRLQHNEYRSFQTLQLNHSNPKVNKITVTGVVFESELNSTVKLGVGSTNLILPQETASSTANKSRLLNERVKVERVFLYNQFQEETGWVSFKYLKTQDQCIDPRFFLQDKFNTIGDMNFKSLQNTSLTISQIKGIQSGAPVMSGLQANSRIYIPKSQRFQNPAKRKLNDKIGLGHQSVDIKDHPTTVTYKVASIGFGRRIIPVERDHDVPGVGRYQLPLLFDKFK